MVNNRGGTTIIEVIISILIVTVGLLASASTMAAATRMLNRGEMSTTASNLALNRFETIRAMTCSNQTSGNLVTGPFTLTWAVSASPIGNANRVFMTTRYDFGRSTRVDSFETSISCI